MNIEDQRYVLQDRDGDYVKEVKGTGLETVKLQFFFTKNKDEAKRFTFDDLWWKLATTCVGGHFTAGFGGGKAVEVT